MLHACFVRSPFARARITGIDVSEALALPGRARRVRGRRPEPRRAGAVVHADGPGRRRHAPAAAGRGRGALRRRPGGAGRGRQPLHRRGRRRPGGRRLRAAPAVADYVDARVDTTSWCTRAIPATSPASWPSRRPTRSTTCSPRRPTSSARRSTSRPTPRCRWRRAASSWSGPRASDELTIWAATQAPHEVRAFASRLLGIPEHRVRVIMRDTGGGFGQKVVPQREDMCIMLAARKVPGAAQVDRGPAREPDVGRPGPPRARRRPDGVRRRRHVPRRPARPRAGRRRLPDAVTRSGRRSPSACSSPGRTGSHARNFSTKLVFSNTVRPHGLPRAVAVRIGRPRGAPRHRRPPDGHRPGRAAPPQPAAPRRAALRQPASACPTTTSRPRRPSSRRSRCSTTTPSAASRPRRGTSGRYLGVGTCTYVEPTASGQGFYGTEGATIRIEPSGKVNVYVAGGSTGNSLETTVVQLAADALGRRHRRRRHDPGRHRGHAVRRGHRRQPQRLDDRRRGRRGGRDPPREDRRDGRPPPRGGRGGHRAGRRAGHRAGHAVRGRDARRARRRSRTSGRRRCRPACRPGSRRARATPRRPR